MGNKEVIEPEVITEVEGIKNNTIATMHNKFVEARYRLTIEEQRIILALISLIQPEDEDFKDYEIPVKVLSELIGTKHKNMYKVIDEATDRLLKRTLKIEIVNDNGKREFEKFNFISYARYKEGKGYIVISIDKHLKPYLLKLKERFTRIPLKYIFPLRSVYAIRLYELLKQYENTGFRVDYLPDLREMLGVEEHEYKVFKDFERRVLKTAVKEINEKTDIDVSYTKKKTGCKITHIGFTIKTKPKTSNIKDEKEIVEKVEMLNQGDTTQTKKSPSETIDNKGQKKVEESDLEKRQNLEKTWGEIRELRKEYNELLNQIMARVKRLNENQVLFLLINTDKTLFPEKLLKEIIINADNNKALNNPMGFLVSTLGIDMQNARFKELTLTVSKIDEDLFKQKLEKMLVEGKPAIEYIRAFWNEVIKPAYEEGKLSVNILKLLKLPLKQAVIDEIENKIYIPAPDSVYKDWLESNNFILDMREFLKMKFNIEDVMIEVVE